MFSFLFSLNTKHKICFFMFFILCFDNFVLFFFAFLIWLLFMEFLIQSEFECPFCFCYELETDSFCICLFELWRIQFSFWILCLTTVNSLRFVSWYILLETWNCKSLETHSYKVKKLRFELNFDHNIWQ
jgi:hypothetical protein